MKRSLLFINLLCFVLISFGQKQFVEDQYAEMRMLNGNFDSIQVSGGIELYLSQSDRKELAVSAAESKFRDGIKTVIENNCLKIYYEGEKRWGYKDRQLRVYVSFTNLEKLKASGASDITIAGELKANNLHIRLSGASHFKGAVKLNSLTIDLSGASMVDISGTVTNGSLECSGASDVNGSSLIMDTCTAKASGASDIRITVNKELNANASGASSILYKGNGIKNSIHISGASSVEQDD